MDANLENIKGWIDLAGKVITIGVGMPAAWWSYVRWLRPAHILASPDTVLFVGPHGGTADGIDNASLIVAVQLRFFNAGAQPESIASINDVQLTLTQNDQRFSYSPFITLRPLKMSSTKPGDIARFHLEPDEFPGSLVIKAEEQSNVTLLFFPDKHQAYDAQPGRVKLEFKIRMMLSSEKIREFTVVKYGEFDAEDVALLKQSPEPITRRLAWLSWHMKDV